MLKPSGLKAPTKISKPGSVLAKTAAPAAAGKEAYYVFEQKPLHALQALCAIVPSVVGRQFFIGTLE